MNIDEWAAEQCGVEIDYNRFIISGAPTYLLPIDNGDSESYVFWSIHDPRCREIVREHFWLSTTRASNSTVLMDGNYWGCTSTNTEIRRLYKKPVFYGKSPAEAEIACITAIYEAQKDE